MTALADRRRGVLAAIDRAVSGSESDVLARTAYLLNDSFPRFTWVGVYRMTGNGLVIESWEGPEPPLHAQIPFGSGIHGVAAQSGRVLAADDMTDPENQPSSFGWSRSEIAVPIVLERRVMGVIAIVSEEIAAFDGADREFLEQIARAVAQHVST